ncbi:hypothetical protein LUZ62_028007 [Rhynchospora pubera]|uniref:Uncharacterized protein n=1 Tax=Rhynchospora pubera TaxID=906938 RepID=A0AAV8HJU1_9POAL|nr:hypothetical protein LUZ62_028007 [Rhynchospora pubera]
MEGIRKFLVTQESDPWKDLKPNIIEFLQEKLTLLLQFIPAIFTYLSEKFDEIFPPETRSDTVQRWVNIAVTIVLPVSVVTFMLYCCCKCCCRCLGRRGGYGRMMKAPGRGGARMPRASFEASPRDYFINLRAKKPLVY